MTDTEHTPMKRYDLMNGINARGAADSKKCPVSPWSGTRKVANRLGHSACVMGAETVLDTVFSTVATCLTWSESDAQTAHVYQ